MNEKELIQAIYEASTSGVYDWKKVQIIKELIEDSKVSINQ
jgi:hypothetical protein